MSQLIKKIRTDAGDLQIDYNALANLPELTSMFSNPNLLINGDFRNPVNQRGKTTYQSTASNFTRIFTVDRWNMQNGMTLTVNDASISLKGDSSASGTCIFSQVLEYCPQGDYVLQVKVLSSVNGSEVCIMNSASEAVLTQTLYVGVNEFTVTNTDIRIVQIHLAPNSEIELEWIKLESGSIATQFVPKLRAEELISWYRFFYTQDSRLLMNQYSSEFADGNIYYPIRMYRVPDVTLLTGTYYSSSQSAFVEPQSIEINTSYFSERNATIKIKKNANDTFSPGMSLNANIQICLDAEIY